MNSTEEELTGALDAAADTVRPGTLRPLPSTAGSRKGAGSRNGARRGWLAPLAAAAAVTLVAVLAVTLTGGQRGTSSGPAVPSPAKVQASRPQFFTEAVGTYLQVRSVATGKLIGKLPLPQLDQSGVWGVAAAPDDRTFYVVQNQVGRHSGTGPAIYSFRITGDDAVTPLRHIATVPVGSRANVTGHNIAISPDGSELALALHTVPNYYFQTDTIVILDLRTGAYHLWRGGLPRTVNGASLNIWDLTWSGARTLDFVASWCGNYVWLFCGPGSAEVRALSVGSAGGSLAGSALLTSLNAYPDVVSVVADRYGRLAILQVPITASKRPTFTIDQVSAAGGALLHVLYRDSVMQVGVYGGDMTGDPSGQYLMVWLHSGHGWLSNGTLRRLPVSPSDSGGFAW